MNMRKQIKEYIATQPEPKRSDMQELHRIILEVMPKCKLWFRLSSNIFFDLFAHVHIKLPLLTMRRTH